MVRTEQVEPAGAPACFFPCKSAVTEFTHPTPAAALREMRRALRPDCRVAIAVWAEIDDPPPFAALEGAVREVAGDELADCYRSGPWGMPGAGQLRELLEHAGFGEIRVTRDELP